MLGDFFTKPLQGTLFMHIREKVLNLPSSTNTTVYRSVLEKTMIEEKVNSYLKKTRQKRAGPTFMRPIRAFKD